MKPRKSLPASLMGQNGKHLTSDSSQPPKGWSHLVHLNYLWQQKAGVSGPGTGSESCLPHIPNCRHGVLAHLLLESTCSFSYLFQVGKAARGAFFLALIMSDIDGTLLLFSLNPQLLYVCAMTCPSSGHPATRQSCSSSCIAKMRQKLEEMKPIPGMPSQTRTFDPAKTQAPSEQGTALTQESVLQSGAAEEPIKCYEMPSLVLVQAGWDVLSDPSVAWRSKSRALPSLLFIPAPQSEEERRCPNYSPTTFELPR